MPTENDSETLRLLYRSVYLPTLREDKKLGERVSSRHGWCDIGSLSGELEEGLYLATFADDLRQVFECDGEHLILMFTQDQEKIWYEELTDEDRIATLEEIAYFYLASEKSEN